MIIFQEERKLSNRPLLIFAAVLILGILIIHKQEVLSSKLGVFVPPAFRTEMEKSEKNFVNGHLSGKVERIEEKQEGFVMIIRGGPEVGKVRAYTEAVFDTLPPIGSIVSLSGKFFLFETLKNPGGFDIRAYYDDLGFWLGFTADRVTVIERGNRPFADCMLKFRHRLILSIRQNASDTDIGIFLNILLGFNDEFDAASEKLFQDSGVLHFLMLSGVMVSLVGNAVYSFFRKITTSLAMSFLFSLVPVFILICLSGFSKTLIRAGIILTVKLAAPLFRRRFDYRNAFCLSVILILFESPGYLFQSGFLYCFSAFISIGFLVPEILKAMDGKKRIYRSVLHLLSLQVSFLPVRLLFDFGISIWTGAISFVFSPFFGMLIVSVMFGAFAGLFSPLFAGFFFGTGHYLIAFLKFLSEISLKLPFSGIINGCPETESVIFFFLLLFGLYLFFRLLNIRRKYVPEEAEKETGAGTRIGILCIYLGLFILGCIILKYHRPSDEAVICQLNVGQGDGTLVMLPDGENYLIDTGSASEEAVYLEVLKPALDYYGISRLDGIFISHFDSDHVNGIADLLEDGKVEIGRIFVPENGEDPEANDMKKAIYEAAARDSIPIITLYKGLYESSGGCTVLCLAPEKGTRYTGNDASMVLELTYGGTSLLYMGDLPGEKEEMIVHGRTADILKAAHHGSKYSTTEGLLKQIRPDFVLLSYGEHNSYGHPSKETIERILSVGAVPVFTGKYPAIIIRVHNKTGYSISYLEK